MCCSTTMSLATLIGIGLVSSFEDANQVRGGLILLARQLPKVLDQTTLDELTIAIDQRSSISNCGRRKCQAASGAEPPRSQDYDQRNDGSSFEPPLATPVAPTSIGLATNTESATVSRWPIA